MEESRLIPLKISSQMAVHWLDSVPHKRFQLTRATRWIEDENRNLAVSSVLWLYCWAKTGMGSPDTAEQARRAFSAMIGIPFTAAESAFDDVWDKVEPYSKNIVPDPALEEELEKLLTTAALASPPPMAWSRTKKPR